MIEHHRLACNLPWTPPGQRRDHRPELQTLRRKCDCRKCNNWIAHRIRPSDLHMIPNKEAVPSGSFGLARKLRQRPWVRIRSEVRQIDCEVHRS
jgi:hypothetical protein